MGIKTARKKAGLTQEDLASKLGINRATLSKYESGGISPTIEMLGKIAFALNCPIKDILDPELDSDGFPQLIKIEGIESVEPTNSPSFIREGELLMSFSILNAEGQQKVVDYAKDLTQIAKYRYFEPPESLLEDGEYTDTTKQEKPPESLKTPSDGK